MANKVWVRATSRGQMPSGGWADEGSPPFQVASAEAVSKRWQVPVEKAEADALDKQAAANARAKAAKDVTPEMRQVLSDLAGVTSERDDLSDKLKAALESVSVLEAERDKLKADLAAAKVPVKEPEKTLLGGDEKKTPDKATSKG